MPESDEILSGVWRFEARHPDWTEEDSEEDGWEPDVAWWAIRAPDGLVLVDPLVEDWNALDGLLRGNGGCAGVIRTVYWHQRSIAEAASRYRAPVHAKPAPDGVPQHPYDEAGRDSDELFGGLRVIEVERDDEIALWLPEQRALLFGDVMLRRAGAKLCVCPDRWVEPNGDPERLRAILAGLTELPVEHVLVAHGPHVTGDGDTALRRALSR